MSFLLSMWQKNKAQTQYLKLFSLSADDKKCHLLTDNEPDFTLYLSKLKGKGSPNK